MTGCELIEGVPADLDEVMATMELAFDPVFGEAWTRAQCVGILCLDGVWLTLARVGGAPAGFALARVVADEAELLLLAVRPGWRGAGVGGALLHSVEARAHALGAARLHLEMREDNPAGALYARHGFAQVGRRSRYYRGRDGRAYDAITLSHPLDLRE